MRFAIRSTVVATCLALLAAAASAQATLQLGGAGSLTIKGFFSATAFAQDQNFAFGNGQNAEYPVPFPGQTAECVVDCWFGGGDIRNTRLTMVFNGPLVLGDWKVNGTLEMDFFGGNNGVGAFSGQQPLPRLRLGFIDFTNGSTTIRMGQQWAPLFGNTAVSLAHIAFPLGYGSAGDIGWRFPGIFVYQNLTSKDSVVNAEIVAAVMSGSWNGPDCTAVTNNCNNSLTAGNAAAPQFELRFNLGGKFSKTSTWSTYIVGHYDQKDLSGAGAKAPGDKITGGAVEIGAKFQIGPFMFQGNGYVGQSIGQNFGMITQFGKIQGAGGWAQVGLDITKMWSVFAFAGIDDPQNADVVKAVGPGGRMRNEMLAAMVRWKCGPLAFGVEYLRDRLRTGVLETRIVGNQWALSGLYNF
jgi:hypothetical protein